jgi:predicted RNA binding protein YcfA (HicA-like mRNA interferase family)
MSAWRSAKARRVLTALLKIGWSIKRQSGSHKTLERSGWPDFVFAFHDGEEIGPHVLARIAKSTGLTQMIYEVTGVTSRSLASVGLTSGYLIQCLLWTIKAEDT